MARRGKQPPPPEALDEELDEDVEDADSGESSSTDVRIDKWMWAARLFKSRSLAVEACDGGHVKVDGVNVKPARLIRLGERVEARTPGGPRIVVVKALSNRRGPAEEAAKLYEDHSPPPPPKAPPVARWERGGGRPTKRDRRRLDRLDGW